MNYFVKVGPLNPHLVLLDKKWGTNSLRVAENPLTPRSQLKTQFPREPPNFGLEDLLPREYGAFVFRAKYEATVRNLQSAYSEMTVLFRKRPNLVT